MTDTCRICRGDSSDGPLRVPCKCIGSISYVHEDCLVDWLAHRYGHNIRTDQSCELCGYVYVFTPVYSADIDTQAAGFLAYLSQIWRGSAGLRAKSNLVIRAIFMALVASNALYSSFSGMTALAEFLSSPAVIKEQNPLYFRFSFPFVDAGRTLYQDPWKLVWQLRIGFGLLVITLIFLIMAWTVSTWITQDPVLTLEVQQLLNTGIELDNEQELIREIEWVKTLVRDVNVNAQARAQLLARIDNGIDQNMNWLPEHDRRLIERNAALNAELFREPPEGEEAVDFWAGADELFGGPLLSRITTFFMFLAIFNGVFVGVFCCLPYMVGYSIMSYIYVHVKDFGFSQIPKSFEYRVLYFFVGLRVFLAFMESPYHNFSRLLKSSQHGRAMIATAKQISAVEKVWIVIVTETILFPLLCGILLNIAVLPVMVNPSVTDFFQDIRNHHRVYLPMLWGAGITYMYSLFDFFKTCRKILRPGVLYFLQDPSDPKNEPIRNFLSSSLYTLFKKIGVSALIYILLILGCIGGVTSFIRWTGIVPVLIAPLDLETMPGWSVLRYWYIPIVGYYMLKSSMGQDEDQEDEQAPSPYIHIFANEFRRAADALDLGSFLFNDDDRRGGDKGTFVRAPAHDNTPLRKGTELFVAVDEDDNRINPQQPGRRDLESYTVVWRPRFFWARIGALFGWIWLVSTVIVLAIVLVPLLVGRGTDYLTTPRDIISNDLVHYISGAFLICTCTNVVDKVLSTHSLLDEITSMVYYRVISLCMTDFIDMVTLWINPQYKEYVQPNARSLTTTQYQLILYALCGEEDAAEINPWQLTGLVAVSCMPRYSRPLNVLVVLIYSAYTFYYSPAVVEWRETAVRNYYIVREEIQDYPGQG